MTQKKSSFRDKIGRNTQKQKDSRKGFGYLDLPKGVPVFAIEGDTREVALDLLPYEVTDPKHPDRDNEYDIATPKSLWYRRPFKVHRNVGVNKETVVCLKSFGKPCPICAYQEKRRKEKADKEEIKELYPRPRSLYVVVPLGVKKVEEVPHVWDMSDYLFQNILNDELDLDEENRDFPSLESGKTLVLKLRWKELGETSFPDVRNISFEDRKPYKENILDEVPNLDEVLIELSYETIEKKFFELEDEPDAGKLEKEEPEKETRRSRREREEEPEKEEKKEKEDIGSRRRSVREDKEEKEEKEEKPEKGSSKRSDKDKEPECPEEGYTFGKDFEKVVKHGKEVCDECDLWNACYDANKKLKK
jgi:hypothetical protein